MVGVQRFKACGQVRCRAGVDHGDPRARLGGGPDEARAVSRGQNENTQLRDVVEQL